MKADVRDGSFKLMVDTGVPGTWAMVGTHPWWPFPISLVWFRYSLDNQRLEILNSYVNEGARRNGFRTRAQVELFKLFDEVNKIETQSGTATGSKWMQAVGYRKNKAGMWSVTRRQFERAEKK